MAAATEENEVNKKIKEVLDGMEPLPGMFSELLQKHRGRRLTAADDLVLRYCKFIQAELSSIVASLNQIYSLSEPPGPDYADNNFLDWLGMSIALAWLTENCLRRSEQADPHCFPRAARLPLPRLYDVQFVLHDLFPVAESSCRYKHLLQDDDDRDQTSRTCSSSVQPYQYAAYAGGSVSLVGIEGTLRNKELRWFMAGRKADKATLKVMSMVGQAGVGKTALAMEVYRQLQQTGGGHHFQCCVTVKVSQGPDMNKLLNHVLSQIDKPEALAPRSSIQPLKITRLQHEQEQDLLAGKINQCLQHKRYLIVIDDIQKESDWYIIKNVFPRNSLGSRIMITTQVRSLAQLCSSHSTDGLVHEVKPLSQLNSERLLFRNVFGSEDSWPPENLKQVCDEILRRCEGIPLLITAYADWLQEQQRELQHISTNYSPEIVPKQLKQIQQASLSNVYHDLPYLSKVLLMYMSMLDDGRLFEKDSLVQKWMCAEGILPRHEFNSENYETYTHALVEAEKYFSELVDRNVITRVANSGHSRQVEEDQHSSWHVSYFMQQFLASKSADKGLTFTSSTLTSRGGKKLGRRLSLHQPDPELPTLLCEMDLSDTRSLSISGEVKGIPFEKFTHLVVLDLEGWQYFKDEDMLLICKMFLLQYLSLRNTTGVSKLPSEIKELQLLIRLDISHTSICELPSQVCELQWLETLDLRSTPVRQLPEQIGNLKMLRRLLVGYDGVNCVKTATEIPEGVRRIIFLDALATVDLNGCSPSFVGAALGGLKYLQVLAITWSFHQCSDGRFQKALRSSIQRWEFLRSLTIHCGLGCYLDFLDPLPHLSCILEKFKMTGGRFARLPQWFTQLNSLTFIEITVCRLEPEDLRILMNLAKLECLVLGLSFIPEAATVIDGVGFNRLKKFSIICRVPWLTFNEGAMEKLTFLELKIAGSVANGESIPSGIENLRSLSEVAICYHPNYTNSPSVKMTVEAVRKGVAEHRMSINLFINGQGEDVEAVEVARASGSQNEIEAEG